MPAGVRRHGVLQWVLLAAALILYPTAEIHAARIKDIGYFLGTRANSLIGYGLVVGLNGTGDKEKTQFTISTLANLLDNMGIHVDPSQVKVKNIAAVMVTGKLPPFVRGGSRIDVEVSSIGDAKNLEGGTLLLTPLMGPDGKTYAVAQGPISTGGFSAGGSSGTKVQKNHPTVGFVSGGATVEQEVNVAYGDLERLDLVLKSPDFTTAGATASSINHTLGGSYAQAIDGGTIRVEIPPAFRQQVVAMVTKIENIELKPDLVAKVIINERTGTIVMGESVRISPVAVAHGGLTVQISEQPAVVQPAPFSEKGRTVVVPQTDVEVKEAKGTLAMVGGVTISQVIKGLNAIGATPRDLINILQAIKASGALQAELEII
ncbi:MAG: flagellar basal body P-ring protein FlgI [Syntrophobacteraceae bacterium]|nr:flagellar basal body P-ring protein FlgI [Syntrophobacteraceae bacterium]